METTISRKEFQDRELILRGRLVNSFKLLERELEKAVFSSGTPDELVTFAYIYVRTYNELCEGLETNDELESYTAIVNQIEERLKG